MSKLKLWGMQRAHAYRLIDAAGVVKSLSPIGDILPATESQVRPLTQLEPEEQAVAWQRIRNQQHAPKTQTQLPQPVRRTVPRLPAPGVVEIPGETVTTDGYRWVALEREVSEVSE